MDKNKTPGDRLREIRLIANEGNKFTTAQFALLLKETAYNLGNYENGRANIPPRILVALYERGFNANWILTGEGSQFADNTRGRELRNSLGKLSGKGEANIIGRADLSAFSNEQLYNRAGELMASAGDILNYLKSREQNGGKKKG